MTAHRTTLAAEYESPIPVNISTYPATHPGHFGTSTNPVIGITH